MIHISDGFLSIEEIINPVVTYEGEFAIDAGILVLASKTKSSLQKFIDKYYHQEICNYFRQDFRTFCEKIDPIFSFKPLADELGGGRCLTFDGSYFLTTVLETFQAYGEEDQRFFEQNREEKIDKKVEYIKARLKQVRKEYKNVLTEKENSPYYEMVKYNIEAKRKKRKNNINRNSFEGNPKTVRNDKLDFYKIKKNREQQIEDEIDLIEVVDQFCSLISKILVNLKSFIAYLEKPLNLQEFAECFDKDKFILLMGENCNWFTRDAIRKYGTVHNSFSYCYVLAQHIEKLKQQNPNFSFKTQTYDKERKKIIFYSTEDFLKDYQELSFAMSDLIVREIPDEELEKERLRNHAYVEKMYEQMREDYKYLKADWEFLAPGERLSLENVPNSPVKTSRKRKDRETQYQNIRRCKLFLDSSPYLFRIAGKNLFDGYIGYVYGNGNIILEKFYRSFKSKIPAIESATYKMRFDKFLEISQMNCLHAVIESKNNEYVRRIRHDHKTELANWFLEMAELTEGREMEEEVKIYMRNLILENKIHKDE